MAIIRLTLKSIDTETLVSCCAEIKRHSKLNFAPRRETCPVPAQYQIFTVETSKIDMNT